MTLKISADAITQINTILANTANAQRYADAYAIVNADLRQTYGGLTLSSNDQDVAHWVGIAEQVNSGVQSVAALLVRFNNQAAVAIELQQNAGCSSRSA
ncbi:MAG: hypothetical protein OJF48_000745 [Afipia sp.]|jgi:hypothetical protein|nr:MAG: hypothetical protein OJF48_000745 [Afipia sp.]